MAGYLFGVRDPLNRRVVLEKARWLGHIIGQRHPELEGQVEAVRLTVTEPEWIMPSRISPSSNVYLHMGASSAYPGLYVKVAVSFKSVPGIVQTAFVTDDMLQGVDREGRIIYARYHR